MLLALALAISHPQHAAARLVLPQGRMHGRWRPLIAQGRRRAPGPLRRGRGLPGGVPPLVLPDAFDQIGSRALVFEV